MKFKSFYMNKPDKTPTNPGHGMEPVYKLMTNEQGRRELQIVGEKDLYAEIQAAKDSCDINLILERFSRGDESALSRLQGVYGDFTEMPTTLAELQQRVLDAEILFNSLPLETRAQFDYDPGVFFNSIGSDKFYTAMGMESDFAPDVSPEPLEPSLGEEIKKEVKIDE